MKVVVFSPYYPPAYKAGGPVKSVSQLVRTPANPFPTLVVSRNWDMRTPGRMRDQANTWDNSGHEWVWAYDRGIGPYVRSLLAVVRQKPQLVYVNSLFDPWMAALPALGWRLVGSRVSDLVIAPRGQVGAAALSRSAFRKRVLLKFWRWLGRHPRVVLHAASEKEERDIEEVLGEVEILVRPNDVGPLLPLLERREKAASVRAMFVGRIVPIKGLLEMLRSLRTVGRSLVLDIYGPIEDERYYALCQAEVARLPASVTATFKGPIDSEAVRARLAEYDVMLNPTRGESFGQALGESLSVGTPVLVADVTPWTAWVRAHAGGRIVRDDAWTEAIEELATMHAAAWQAMRHGARQAYEHRWQDAQCLPHLFELVVDRR